ncbi:MAG: hypothetical protein ACKVGW_13810 [Verrucomicrobiia bacterium]|jgi:hypothetical protein
MKYPLINFKKTATCLALVGLVAGFATSASAVTVTDVYQATEAKKSCYLAAEYKSKIQEEFSDKSAVH